MAMTRQQVVDMWDEATEVAATRYVVDTARASTGVAPDGSKVVATSVATSTGSTVNNGLTAAMANSGDRRLAEDTTGISES